MIPLIRIIRKKKLILVFIFVVLVLVFNFHQDRIKAEIGKDQLLTEIKYNEHDATYIHKLFLNEYPIETVLDLPLNQRCDLFFDFMLKHEKSWVIDPKEKYDIDFKSEGFKEYAMKFGIKLSKEYKKKYGKHDDKSSHEQLLNSNIEYEYYMYQSSINEIAIMHRLTMIRIYNKCMSQTQNSITIEEKLYPWLSKQFPKYENWNGELKTPKMNPDETVLTQFQQRSSGKGVVVTIAEKHVDDMINLIHLLRALKNKLPIEIIYTELSNESKSRISKAARDDYMNFPTQDIWFVDVNPAILEEHRSIFEKFDYKLLSILFNSFEEFILLDADTVLFKSPSYFFNIKGYKNTGAFFFKDRGFLHRRSLEDGKLFASFSPSIFDTAMFDIPRLTNHTLSNPYFKGLTHFQESGVVVINKKKHFQSLLMIIQLTFIHPISMKVWGDKELYWMGFALNGDENYAFNDNFAGVVGSLTPESERIRPDGKNFNGKEICSSHPGHISSEDGSLLWMNTGFKYCGKKVSSYDEEAEKNKKTNLWKHLKTGEDFKNFYNSPVKITHAIIPPLDDELKERENSDGEPDKGWYWPQKFCKSYVWCGYTSIGGDNDTLEGDLISFTDKEVNFYEKLGNIWMGLEE
ncbi:putative alpha-1,3-mannosyltransferase MNN13 [Candida tropicalis]